MKRMMPAIFWFGLGLGLLFAGGCPKKEEERIIITIQTEKVEEAQSARSRPVAQPEVKSKEAPEGRKPESSATGGSGGPPPVVAEAPTVSSREATPPPPAPAPSPSVSKEPETPPPPAPARSPETSSQEVSLVPMAPPSQAPSRLPPRRPATEEDGIMAIVRRQEVAFEGKDVALYTADLITVTPKLKKEVERFFEQYNEIEVSFETQEITVQDTSAQVIMLQTTHLVPKRGGKAQSTKAKILWGLIKVDGDWKISETQILEKY